MLVKNIMKVLKNLFGLNKKISASEIAFKDVNNSAFTLDQYLINLGTYSTEEQRIGTWIDGEPIYRLVVEYTLGNAINTYKDVVTIPNIKKMINAYGWFTNVNVQFRFPTAYDNEDIMIYLDMSNRRIREKHNYSYANGKPAYITLEYTKTTD